MTAYNGPVALPETDDLIREQAYLISRGTRPLALIGECPADDVAMLQAATRIETLALEGCVPFVIDRGDGIAECGYAAASWAVDLYRWLTTEANGTVPEEHRARVCGLLFGYSVEAIRDFEERRSGRLFRSPTASDEPAAS